MTCFETRPLLHAWFDDELDLSRSYEIGEHLAGCPECAAEVQKWERLRAAIGESDFNPSEDAVLRRVRRSVRKQAGFERIPMVWKSATAALAAAAVILLAVALPGRLNRTSADTNREIIDSHLRSLAGGHLIDIPSSDRHTVKPWFQGKVEFAPPVPDLSVEGFALEGGRLDVIGGHKTAAIVYKRREHVINLWVSPGSATPAEPASAGFASVDYDGYHLLRWSRDGLTYRAVSDLDPGELRDFATSFTRASSANR
jgi:anti-sigma factor RsiW